MHVCTLDSSSRLPLPFEKTALNSARSFAGPRHDFTFTLTRTLPDTWAASCVSAGDTAENGGRAGPRHDFTFTLTRTLPYTWAASCVSADDPAENGGRARCRYSYYSQSRAVQEDFWRLEAQPRRKDLGTQAQAR